MWGSGGGEQGGQEMTEGRKRRKLDWKSEEDIRVKKRWEKGNSGCKKRETEEGKRDVTLCNVQWDTRSKRFLFAAMLSLSFTSYIGKQPVIHSKTSNQSFNRLLSPVMTIVLNIFERENKKKCIFSYWQKLFQIKKIVAETSKSVVPELELSKWAI